MARRALFALLVLAAATSGIARSGATFTASTANPGNVLTAASDWVAPTVVLSDPGSPMRGSTTFAAAATDTGSGVASVAFQTRPAGSATWTTACSAATAPYTCTYDTRQLADGTYDVRALATDRAGNEATSVVSDRAVDNSVFGVTLADPGSFLRGSVSLSASVGGSPVVAAVRIQIRQVDASNWTDVCVDATAPYSCTLDTTRFAENLYAFRATATNAAGTTVTSSEIADVQIDNVAPAVTLADPGLMSGVVTLSATASDADAGVASVVFQRSPAGKATWTTICADSADPYSCRFDTTAGATPDGSYDLRAVATDYAGNTTTSTVGGRTIDNTVSSVSLDDPGAYLKGTVALTAAASASGGVKNVAIQRRVAGTTTWTTICTDAAAPYSCAFDTTTVADGQYDFQAVMTSNSGSTLTSNLVAARQVDNVALRGVDVQAVNRTGGTTGRPETGDSIAFTWTQPVKPSSLVAGWSSGSQAVSVRLRDGALAGTTGNNDVLDVLTTSGAVTGFGTVALRGDYVKKGKTVTFAATATMSGTTVTIVLGTSSGGGVRTWNTPSSMAWTPSSRATDAGGAASSVAPVTESGTADRDF